MTGANSSASPLKWATLSLRRGSATQGVPPGTEDLQWVSNAVTLIYGERDAVLVDTFLYASQQQVLVEWVASFGRSLTTIYVTHGHPDHFFGLTALLERFPAAKAIGVPGAVESMKWAATESVIKNNWEKRWPGEIPEQITIAEPFDGDRFYLEGNEIRIIETGHTDTDHTTGLFVPSIGLLVSGDAAYNETHPFLAESDLEGRNAWISALDKLEGYEADHVIAGHAVLEADHSPIHIAATRRYIQDFNRVSEAGSSAEDIFEKMLALYPARVNPGSLWAAAQAEIGRRGDATA